MVYVAINEKSRKGKSLLIYLKSLADKDKFVDFIDEELELLSAIDDAMKTPVIKSGNSLREII